MADQKTTALSAFTPVLSDILYGVDDPGGTPVSGKVTFTAVRDLLEANFTALTVATGTITADEPVLSGSQTWNAAGVTFTGLKLNVTDTASASASNLVDVQKGGTTQFRVTKGGRGGFQGGYEAPDQGDFLFYRSNTLALRAGSTVFQMPNEFRVAASGTGVNGNDFISFFGDGVDILAQRRSTNPQTFNIYNTFTDASNGEWGGFRWNSNVLEIRSTANGTGTARPVSLTPADIRMPNLPTADPTVAGQLWNDTGTLKVSAG